MSLIPWGAFLLAVATTGALVDESIPLAGVVVGAPIYLGLVALPSLLPLAVARAALMRLFVLIVMTVVAVTAGALMTISDDAQAGLAVFLIPQVAIPVATLLWIGQAVAARLPGTGSPTEPQFVPATPSDRLAALAIDVAVIGAALVVPLTAMSHAKQEIAAGILGLAVATVCLAVPVTKRGATLGQTLLGLSVLDARTLERIALSRSLVRALIVVVEVAATATIVLSPPAMAELMVTAGSGRSLTDRLLGTSVLTTR